MEVYPGLPVLHQIISTKTQLELQHVLETTNPDLFETRYDGATGLFVICESNLVDSLRLMINHAKAQNIDLNDLINKPISTGATPLHVACFLGFDSIVQILLDEGADMNTQLNSNRNSPLYDSINQRHFSIAQLLLTKNADPNVLCINGGNCMHAAAYSGSTELISQLHQAGTSLTSKVSFKKNFISLFLMFFFLFVTFIESSSWRNSYAYCFSSWKYFCY